MAKRHPKAWKDKANQFYQSNPQIGPTQFNSKLHEVGVMVNLNTSTSWLWKLRRGEFVENLEPNSYLSLEARIHRLEMKVFPTQEVK